jgi:hypothetical protein
MMHPTQHITSPQLRRNAAGRPMHCGAMIIIAGLLFITPVALGQLVQINLQIEPKTTLQADQTFTFHFVPDFKTGTGHYEGTYSVMISAPENQMIHLSYNTGAQLLTPEGKAQPIVTSICYNNSLGGDLSEPASDQFTCPTITISENQTTTFPISNQNLLIEAIPHQPVMLFARVAINLQTPLPQYPADLYTSDILLCIEYN